MPLYTISTTNELKAGDKKQIAGKVTDLHCGATDAPREFVHVFFTGGFPLAAGNEAHVVASVRAGRPQTTNDTLEHGLKKILTDYIKAGPERVNVDLIEVAAGTVVEFGEIMPEPGEEGPWLQKMKKQFLTT